MLRVKFNHTNYSELLHYFANSFNGKVVNNVFQFPPSIATGFMKLVEMPNGLQGIISDYTLNTDLLLTRSRIPEDFYTLRFDEVLMKELPANGNSGINEPGSVKSAVFLGSTKFDWMFLCNAGTKVKGINILFSRDWLENFLKIEATGDEMVKFLSLNMSAFNYEPMDIEYKRMLSEIAGTGIDPKFETFIIQNRVMLLLERFFTRTYYKMDNMHFDVKVSNEIIGRLKLVERELVNDFSVEPASINKLARMAVLSPSKLKSSFKEIYGLPVYRYFQKHRMNKAKAMLLSKKYSVKEVGLEVGYSNLSNFAKAFRKSFDQLPGDLLNR